MSSVWFEGGGMVKVDDNIRREVLYTVYVVCKEIFKIRWKKVIMVRNYRKEDLLRGRF